MTSVSGRSVVAAVLVASLLVLSASVVVVGSHNDGESGASDFRVHTYGGPPADQRAPGATDRSYWTESTTDAVPEGKKLYLTKTVTYRPVPSDCAPEDTETFGIDRDATYEGERRVDESATESVKSFGKEANIRDRYESEYGQYGDLTTTDFAYVERLRVDWYGPDDFGAPLEIYRGDRFVSAQRGCLDNPDAAGWYRFASINEGEFENGTTVRQEVPTFSHWFYICECSSRQEAVETLGPPPSEEREATPTPTASGSGARTPTATPAGSPETGDDTTGSDDDGRSRETPGADERPAPTASPTPTRTAVESGAAGAGGPSGRATPTPDWDDRVLETPTAAEGDGFTPLAALVALLAAVVGLSRR